MKTTKRGTFRAFIILLVLGISLAAINIYDNIYVSTFHEENKGEIETALNEVVKEHVKKNKFSGSVLVAQGNKIILNEGYGYAKRYLGRTQNTPNTKYVLGSMTKTFTALAIMQLKEKNLLNLEDRVIKYYPEYKGWEGITIHHLLNHTSGIQNYYKSVLDYARYFITHNTPEKIMSRFKETPLLFQPGTDYEYSNTNYIVLTGIIEMVSGDTYIDYLTKNIFSPLGLVRTGYNEHPDSVSNLAKGYLLNMVVEVNGFNLSNFYGAGGLYSTTEDLYQFLKSLDEHELINDASTVSVRAGSEYEYGYGMMFTNNKNYGKTFFITGGGPGISTGMYKLVDKDTIIVILSNNQGFDTDEMVADLYSSIKSLQS